MVAFSIAFAEELRILDGLFEDRLLLLSMESILVRVDPDRVGEGAVGKAFGRREDALEKICDCEG